MEKESINAEIQNIPMIKISSADSLRMHIELIYILIQNKLSVSEHYAGCFFMIFN